MKPQRLLGLVLDWTRKKIRGPSVSRTRRPAKLGIASLPDRDGPSALTDVGASALIAPSTSSAAVEPAETSGSVRSDVPLVRVGASFKAFAEIGAGTNPNAQSAPTIAVRGMADAGDSIAGTAIGFNTSSTFPDSSGSLRIDLPDSTRLLESAVASQGQAKGNDSAGSPPSASAPIQFARATNTADEQASSVAPPSDSSQSAHLGSLFISLSPQGTGSSPDSKTSPVPAKSEHVDVKPAPKLTPLVDRPAKTVSALLAMDTSTATDSPPSGRLTANVPEGGASAFEGDAWNTPEIKSITSAVDGPNDGITLTPGTQAPLMAEHTELQIVSAKPSPNSLGQTLSAKDELFQLSRPTAGDQDLTVKYSLTEYDSAGENTHEGVSVIPAGSTQASIFAGPELAGRQPQVLIVTVHEQPGYQSATPIATRLLSAAGGRVSDTALFAAYRLGGSQEAFSALVQQHRPTVLRTCQRIVGNWSDAEDVSQFVFLALTQLQVRPSISLGGWLHRVSRNAAISFLRSKSRRDRHEFAAAKPAGNEPDEATRSMRDSLDVAIEKLPVPVRQAVQLRYIEGWSQQEAAQIVGVPRGTLAQRASQGIHLLRKLLMSDHAATG